MAVYASVERTKRLRAYYDFRGGLNTDAAIDNLMDNELMRADNIDLDERGGIMKRKGTIRLNKEHYGGQVEQIFEWPRSDGQVWLMAVVTIGGVSKLYRVREDQDYALEEVATVARPNIGYVHIPNPGPGGRDLLYFVDGQQYRVWDGEEVKLIAETIPDPPEAPPTVEAVDTPAGVESDLKPGIYRCAVTYATGIEGIDLADFEEGLIPSSIFGRLLFIFRTFYIASTKDHIPIGESNPSDIVEVEVKEGQSIRWSNFPTPPPEAKAIILYRSTADGTDLHFVAAIKAPVPSGVSFSERTPDGELRQRRTMRWGNNLAAVAKCTHLVKHPNSYRVFAAGNPDDPAAVYFSEPGEPDHFKPSSSVRPTEGDGPVQALAVFGDALVVFYPHSVWVWQGLDPDHDATWKRIPTGVGTTSPKSITLTPNSLTFLGRGGLYAISPAVLGLDVTIEPTQGLIQNLARNKVERLIREMSNPSVAAGVFDSQNQRLLLACTDADGVRNNQILVFDWNLGAFTRYTNLAVNDFLQRLNGDLLAATNGYILKMGVGDRDHDDQPIVMDVLTKAYNLDYPFHKKRLLRLYCAFRQPEQETSAIVVRIYVDDILRHEITEHALWENFVWGKSIWGEAIWGFRRFVTTRSRIYGSGHRVQVQFYNEKIDDPVAVYGIAFEFRPSRAKGRLL